MIHAPFLKSIQRQQLEDLTCILRFYAFFKEVIVHLF